jgi:hypothetical protein
MKINRLNELREMSAELLKITVKERDDFEKESIKWKDLYYENEDREIYMKIFLKNL